MTTPYYRVDFSNHAGSDAKFAFWKDAGEFSTLEAAKEYIRTTDQMGHYRIVKIVEKTIYETEVV